MYCKVGTEFDLSQCIVKQGTSKEKNRPWLMIAPLQENKHQREYTFFADNAIEASRFRGFAKVKQINGIKTDKKLVNGQYYTNVTVYGILEGVNPTAKEEKKVADEFDEILAKADEKKNDFVDFPGSDEFPFM